MSAAPPSVATLGDMPRIWTFVRDAAGQIPFALESEREQEAVLSELMASLSSGFTQVAFDAGGAVQGALLARRDTFEWGFRNSPALHVTYAALAPEAAAADLVPALLAPLKEGRAPIYFSVRAGNALDLAALLPSLGFEHLAKSPWGDLYLWEPRKPH
ncbi:hypothetical protein [Xanthobacter sp. KR7-225]|uniref:hypothetical protein n=1 Tax=Xanthobacter sp. KR7-225 TaxID=3156613 RepID=UPI0032B4E6F6